MAGTPFAQDTYSSGSTNKGKTSDTQGSDFATNTAFYSSNTVGTSNSGSGTSSGSHSFFNIDSDGNFNGGTTSYTASASGTSRTTYGDTSGSSSYSYTSRGSIFTSTNNQNGGAGGANPYNGGSGSDEGSFTLDPKTFALTTLTDITLRWITTRTLSDTEDYYGLWFLTSEASNTAGTQLAYTSTAKRPIIDYVGGTTTVSDTTYTTSTCIRSHKEVWNAYEPLFGGNDYYARVSVQAFLMTNTSVPSFNSNGLYLISVIAPTTAGYGKSAVIPISSEIKDVIGVAAAQKTVADYNVNDPATNTYYFHYNLIGSNITISLHRNAESTDILEGNQYLTTISDSNNTNQSIYSRSYADPYSTSAIYDTSEQINEALYGWPAVSVSTLTAGQFSGSITGERFLVTQTLDTFLSISSFFDSTTLETPRGNHLKTTETYYGEVDYSYSTSNTDQSGSTNIAKNGKAGRMTYFTNDDPNYTGMAFGAGIDSGRGGGLNKIFTGLQLIDFLLQDPYLKGTAYPMAKELDGGFNTMGYLGGGYPNPANFFNFTDNLAGGMGGGYGLGFIEACHRINISANYAGDEFGVTNAYCPPIRNTSISWLSRTSNTTGTTQFLTYSFGTSPTYSITTANKRSNSTATITSGTTTKRWSTAGSLEVGHNNLYGVFSDWQQTAQYSTFGTSFQIIDPICLIATDYNSTGGSSTKTIRGLANGDLSPVDTIDYSVTRYLGKRLNVNLAPNTLDNTYYFNPAIALYLRPAPLSYVGMIGRVPFSRRAGASVNADYPNQIGYPSYNVTAQFSDPSF